MAIDGADFNQRALRADGRSRSAPAPPAPIPVTGRGLPATRWTARMSFDSRSVERLPALEQAVCAQRCRRPPRQGSNQRARGRASTRSNRSRSPDQAVRELIPGQAPIGPRVAPHLLQRLQELEGKAQSSQAPRNGGVDLRRSRPGRPSRPHAR